MGIPEITLCRILAFCVGFWNPFQPGPGRGGQEEAATLESFPAQEISSEDGHVAQDVRAVPGRMRFLGRCRVLVGISTVPDVGVSLEALRLEPFESI